MQYKVLVADAVRQHSFRVASALKKENLLFQYLTTVYYKDKLNWTHIVSFFLKGDSLNRAKKRRCIDLQDSDVTQFKEFLGVILLLIQRIDRKRYFTNRLNNYISKSFQIKVAKYAIKNNVDAIISYDTNSNYMFDYLIKYAPNIIRIIDDAHPNRNFLYKVYQEKMESAGEFRKTFEACGYLLNKSVADKYGIESKKAHYHIVASSFSAESVRYNGFKNQSIFRIPYGVNRNDFMSSKKDYDKLNLLFVGEVNQRKGIRQILDSAKVIASKDIVYHIVGTGAEYHQDLYKPYDKYVNFYGRVPFELLQDLFSKSSIFIFPSMGEGFGLVVLEALSAGLPVIVSKNCCGTDIIKDGYNGFVIEAGDTKELINKINWFIENKEKLPEMSRNAIKTAELYTWEKYEKEICIAVRKMIEKKGNSNE